VSALTRDPAGPSRFPGAAAELLDPVWRPAPVSAGREEATASLAAMNAAAALISEMTPSNCVADTLVMAYTAKPSTARPSMVNMYVCKLRRSARRTAASDAVEIGSA
jgi:hypothetical protein